MAKETQYEIVSDKIESAKKNGKTRIYVQPLYDETISKLEQDGVTVERIMLKEQGIIRCFDMVNLNISPEGCFDENAVKTEEFMAILKMIELGL